MKQAIETPLGHVQHGADLNMPSQKNLANSGYAKSGSVLSSSHEADKGSHN